MIELKNISHHYGEHQVFRNLNMQIQSQQLTSLLGPSGCGKSTLLRFLAGFEKPQQGQIVLDQQMKISFVFQEPNLLPWRTVEKNILLPCELQKIEVSEHKLNSLLELVDLKKFKKFYPHQLSGGMKMRVSLARALISNPELLLMDEPFSALDETTRFKLQEELHEIQKNNALSIIFVTHSASEAVFLSDEIFCLSKFQKNILQKIQVQLGLERKNELRYDLKYNDYVAKLSERLKADAQE